MPWKPSAAPKHSKAAKTPREQREWADVANSVRAKTGDDVRAIREADAVVKRTAKRKG